ncbi:MAG: serine hydrolase [Vicinamibacterales bacterium]
MTHVTSSRRPAAGRRLARIGLTGFTAFLLAAPGLVARQAAARAGGGGQAAAQAATYFPAKGAWERREPAALGLDRATLDEAIAFANEHQNGNTKNLAEDIPRTFGREAPYNALIGPTRERTGMNGIVIRHGYVAATWGDVDRADMTFSVTKSFLSTTVGLAFDRGLIRHVADRVAPYMPDGVDLFTADHNRDITWEHLLRQSSDWSGTLWGKPDWADRPVGNSPAEWEAREMHAPGTYYKYNDTRVNVLALAALHVFRQPLPEVLKANIMDPIGASDTWHWEGYENSWVTIDGRRMQSVTGGGHWGGGMFINAWDLARFGYLFLNDGRWNDRQLISKTWIGMARTPGPANENYGYMNWFLNTRHPITNGRPARQSLPSAPVSAVTFQGNGANLVYIDWEHDLVVVVRWISGNYDGFFAKVLEALRT